MSLEEIKNAKNPFSKDAETEFVKDMLNVITDAAVDEVIKDAGDWDKVDSTVLFASIARGYEKILQRFIGTGTEQQEIIEKIISKGIEDFDPQENTLGCRWD